MPMSPRLTTSQLGASLGLVKDRMAMPDVNDVQTDMSAYLAAINNMMQGFAGNLTEAIFDDPDVLYPMIQDGLFFAAEGETPLDTDSSFDVSQAIQRNVFAASLPAVWGKCQDLGHVPIPFEFGLRTELLIFD